MLCVGGSSAHRSADGRWFFSNSRCLRLACALHSKGDAAHGDLEQVEKLAAAGSVAGPVAPLVEETNLKVVERVHVRIAKADGLREHWLAPEQVRRAIHLQHPAHAAAEFFLDAPENLLAEPLRPDARHIARSNVEVGLGEGDFGIVKERSEKRPGTVHLPKQAESWAAVDGGKLVERGAQAVPGRHELARLRPGEDPGNGPQVFDMEFTFAGRPAAG